MLFRSSPLTVFTCIVATSAVITASAELSALAALDVRKVLSGQWWRLITGHLAHVTWRQFQADAAVFLLSYTAYAKSRGLAAALALALFSAVGVSLSVILAGNFQVYAGLSGLGCAGFSAILAARLAARPTQPVSWLLAMLFAGFLAVGEGGSESGVEIASEAHFAGAACGLLFALIHNTRLKFLFAGWEKL